MEVLDIQVNNSKFICCFVLQKVIFFIPSETGTEYRFPVGLGSKTP